MKKLIFLFALLACIVTVQAQTIVDWPESIVFYHENGDAQSIMKKHVAALDINNSKVVLLTTVGKFSMSTEEFGFDTDSLFCIYLDALIGGHYYTIYKENSDGNVDSIEYHYISPTDTTLHYINAMAYPSDTVTNSTIVPQ
jgi:hypothetical protein